MNWQPPKRKLTIFYDDLCPICVTACDWMKRRNSYVELEFLKQSEAQTKQRFGDFLIRDGVQQFIVIADDKDVYRGNAARMVCFSALKGFRLLAYLLGNPLSFRISDFLLEWFARNRYRISKILLLKEPKTLCESGHCQVRKMKEGAKQ